MVSTGKGLTQLSTTGGMLAWEYSAIVALMKDGGKFATKNVISSTVGVSLALFGIELTFNAIKYFKGDISRREFGKRTLKSGAQSLIIGGGTTLGMTGGAVLGAKIGCIGGPTGAVIGTLAGFLIAALAAYGSSVAIDSMIPDDEDLERRKSINEALLWFHFKDPNIIRNTDKFNKKILKHIYKKYLMVSHPDKPGGSQAKFISLQTYYGILIALCDQNDKEKQRLIKALAKLKK